MNKQKIILVDWGHFVHTSIYNKNGLLRTKNELLIKADAFKKAGDYFNCNKCKNQSEKILVMPATYTSMTMLIGNLKKIGVNKELDRVFICCDAHSVKYHLRCHIERFDNGEGLELYRPKEDEESHIMGKCEYCQEDIYNDEQFGWFGGNWRKIYEKDYKGNRDEVKKQANFVDWTKEYKWHDQLIEKIEYGTNFNIIKANTLEADDLVAIGSRYFKDYECIILGQDHDYDQLLIQDNTKIFNPHKAVKLYPYRILDLDRDKEIKKAYDSLQKKIKKETADNLVGELLTEEDSDNRELCVKLIELPDFVTNPAIEAFEYAHKKDDGDLSVFSSGIQKRFNDIYKEDKIITYDYCKEKQSKKLERSRKTKNKKGKKVIITDINIPEEYTPGDTFFCKSSKRTNFSEKSVKNLKIKKN